MLYQLSYASTAQTEKRYQKGTSIARLSNRGPAVSTLRHQTNCAGELIVQHPGWVCAEARSGRDAISQIQQRAPDILILDLRMSAMDGLQAARTISKLLPDLPILLCTSSAVPLSLVSMAQRCGIKGTVSKYDCRQIEMGIEALLRHVTFFCRN